MERNVMLGMTTTVARKSALPILLTMGDPAGVGPEIAVRALCEDVIPNNNNSNGRESFCDDADVDRDNIIVVGDINIMQKAANACQLFPRFFVVDDLDDVVVSDDDCHAKIISDDDRPTIKILHVPSDISADNFTPGKPQAVCGRAAYSYIIRAIDLALAGNAAAIVTNPISKEALCLAEINYPGHTEIFAGKTGTADYSMIFLLDNVAVAHVTTHVSLRAAIEMITKDRVLRQIKLLHNSLKNLGLDPPRVAVGGLNPHAGENGLFGDEELREIIPAVAEARSCGLDVSGPFPPDTIFTRAFGGEFNGVVSMLHDHGFVALKSRDFDHGVNITAGLPIIRTSVGHGTAFDRAWGGGGGILREFALGDPVGGLDCRAPQKLNIFLIDFPAQINRFG